MNVMKSATSKGIFFGEGVILAAVNSIVYSSLRNPYTFLSMAALLLKVALVSVRVNDRDMIETLVLT